MKSIFSALLVFTFVLFIGGCGSKHVTGNETLSGSNVTQIEEKLIVNKTTKKDVENWLGTPSGVTKDGVGNDIWTYNYGASVVRVRGETFIPIIGGFVGGADSKNENKVLVITFAPSNTVSSYSFTGSDGGSRN